MNKERNLQYYQEYHDWLRKKMDEPLYAHLEKRGSKICDIYWKDYGICSGIIQKAEEEEKARNILVGRTEDYLDLSGSREEMPYKDLLIKDNPNLETLIIDNCLLEKIKVVNCPNLKTLSCRHNYRITEIDISECPSLEGLYCSNNEIKKLDLSKNLNLKHLVCDNNPIKQLEIKHLSNLESLYCFNCDLKKLDVSGLKNLKELYCANSVSLSSLSVDGCSSLEELDCAENSLKKLVVIDKPKLKQISCKENNLYFIEIANCPVLTFVDASRQVNDPSVLRMLNNGIISGKEARELAYKRRISIKLSNLFSLSYIRFPEADNKITDQKGKDLKKSDFPNLKTMEKLVSTEEGFEVVELNIFSEPVKEEVSFAPAPFFSSPPSFFNKLKDFKSKLKKNKVNPELPKPKNQNGQHSFNQTIKEKENKRIISPSNQPTNYTPYLIGGGILVLGLLVILSLIKITKRKIRKLISKK